MAKTKKSSTTNSNNKDNSNNEQQQQQQQEPQQQSNKQLFTVSSIIEDEITKISMKYWLSGADKSLFKDEIVNDIYDKEIHPSTTNNNRIAILELSHYLENYLYPNFNDETSTNFKYLMSIIVMINEKSKEEFLIDLLTQITTRRFLFALLDDYHLVVKVSQSKFSSQNNNDSKTFNELLGILKFYLNFEINNFTGEELSREQISSDHYQNIKSLQRLVFKEFHEIKEFALKNISSIETKKTILNDLSVLSQERLNQLCYLLNLIPKDSKESKEFLLSILVSKYQMKTSQIESINSTPLYPTESILWDETIIPNSTYYGDRSLSLPKLNLQFLSFNDYLIRNFTLLRLESSFEIRQDIEDSIKRMAPKLSETQQSTTFNGWSRMALPLHSFKITNVQKPNVGESKPKMVVGNLSFNIRSIKQQSVKEEWDSLKEHDILFLISIKSKTKTNEKYNINEPFPQAYGIESIRGCEVIGLYDEQGKPLSNDLHLDQNMKPGHKSMNSSSTADNRYLKVSLDCNQYQKDLEENKLGIYDSFNVVLRRNPKENNFKAVMETIISLINSTNHLPDWLNSLFLGYPNDTTGGNKIGDQVLLNDTFLNYDHLINSFPTNKLEISENCNKQGPFKLKFATENNIQVDSYENSNSIITTTSTVSNSNKIKFTPTQVKAIISGTSQGLTLIVGPPGTGKTDVAVQIISNIYHNYPNQRTLIVTHSNQALNQLFEKIYQLDINERYLLRLGHGHKQLNTDKDFTKSGRIDFMLNLRLKQLYQVDCLAKSMNILDDVSYTCETACHFYSYRVLSKWEEFQSNCQYFKNHPDFSNQPLFSGDKSYEENRKITLNLWNYIENIFKELEECKVFELLKSPTDRFNYLLLKQSKIVAMTCTHAALKRNELLELGFKFDNLLMEESGQILDIESFIPLQLQHTEFTESDRLKRVILIGDHNQLPPVVKNMSLQKFSHFDQSLFARLIRLQVPHITLDQQGRSRSSISEMFIWKYKGLGNLAQTETLPMFQTANPGLAYDYQIINVDEVDGFGQGETEPYPHFYQNLGEAEYIVAMYQYMRLMGYPSEKITILTTYNGQKALIRNIIQEKCKNDPLFGSPHKITTVDKYQGQQNDYVLLSLVRTKTYGHIRDIRRLIVAMSRARLGLYIFCKKSFFQNCYETSLVFSKLMKRPDKLILVQGETYPTDRSNNTQPNPDDCFEIQNSFHLKELIQSNLNN
eukprot:gene2420-2988_t